MRPSNQKILCHVDDIKEGGCKGFELDNLNLFIVKKRGELFLYQNRCPHASMPLNWAPDRFLDRDGELIICASHGALFQIENGRCVAGPCPGQSLTPIPFEIVDNQITLN